MRTTLPPALKGRPWLIVLVVFVLYAILVWFLGGWLKLVGSDLWILRIGLWVLGLGAAGFVLWFLRPAGRGSDADDELDAVITAARKRLATVGPAGRRGFARRPMIVVLGPAGSTKTTSVVYSGLEPDLVAGAVFQGEQVGPTAAANVWYAHDTVIVEAGGPVLSTPARWQRLVRAVRPPRLAAALTGRPQAPRAALVCFSLEEFVKAGAAEAVPRAARELRGALMQLARGFGVQLPVYVLFTKADRVPFFAEFVSRLSREEAWDALGTALRWPEYQAAGLYAERGFQRAATGFQVVADALAAKRLDLLARESDADAQGSLYEFPREVRKLESLAVQFLVELCRPRHLATSPVLRGFYLTGVRAVVVTDRAADDPAPARAAPRARRATSVFGERALEAPAPAPSGTTRRVPEWVFLGRMFRDVVLKDRAAAAVAQRGAGVGLIRRVLLAAAVVFGVILSLGLITSYVANGRLERRVFAAMNALPSAAIADPGLADVQTLRQLDTVRLQLQQLARYRDEGRPMRLGWGLYTGTALFDAARPMYLDRFERLLLLPARAALLRSLRTLPDGPAEAGDYGRTYDLLRAYLMVSNRTDRMDAELLVPVLLERWLDGRQVDAERAELARAQFTFYAGGLCRDGSCATEADGPLVTRTRDLLRRYAGPERIYRLMVARAGTGAEPVALARRFPAAASVVTDPYEVPAAFTQAGWGAMQQAIANVDDFLRAEDWVVGESAPLQLDRAGLTDQLRTLYVQDYVRHWTAFLTSASVAEFRGLSDAARKLRQLSGNESPLLQLFALASANTGADSATVGRTFRALHQVVPPGTGDTYIGESNQGYMNALIGLGNLVEQAAGASPGEAEGLSDQTLQAARTAKDAVRQLALAFPPEGEAGTVSTAVQRLMEAPITRIEGMVGRLPTTAINSRGAAFCGPFRQLTSKYPFSPNASAEAPYDEVAGLLQPGTGRLWAFYDEYLQGSLALQGSRYAPRVGASMPLTREFVDFFNQAAAISRALWPAGDTARVDFVFKPQLSDAVPMATLSVDGYTGRWTRTVTAQRPFSWVGPRANDVQLTAQVRGREVTLRYRGTWGLFKLFQQAEWRSSGAGGVARWQLDAQGEPVTLEAEVVLAGAPVLQRGFFAGLSCVSRVAR